MMFIWNFLTVHIPWPAYLFAVGFAVVALAILSKVYGFNLPAPVLGVLAGAAALLVLIAKSTQKGYDLRKADEKAAEDKAIKTVDDTKKSVDAMPDTQLDHEVDQWTRK